MRLPEGRTVRSREQAVKIDAWHHYQNQQNKQHLYALKTLQDSLQQQCADIRTQLQQTLSHNADLLDKQLKRLTQEVDRRLILISGQVATRKQVHIIQEHLGYLSKDFERFQTRMNQLARHIEQASNDVALVHKSSKKISSRFKKIGNVELDYTRDDTSLKDSAEDA